MNNNRWFFDQMRGDIPTIRLSSDAKNYEAPEIVEQILMPGRDTPALPEMTEENTCPTCGQYVDACSGCGGPMMEHDED